MGSIEEYRRRAAEAEALAKAAKTADEREAYKKIARGWLDLITAAERRRNGG